MSSLPEVPRNQIIKELLKQFTIDTRQASKAVERMTTSMQASTQQMAFMYRNIAQRYGQAAAMPYTQPGFSEQEPDLAIGSLFGVRQFKITVTPFWDDAGHQVTQLSGMRGAWRPGENTATCLETRAVCEEVPVDDVIWPLNPYAVNDMAYRRRIVSRAHNFDEIPSVNCGCGYWAYWAERSAQAMSAPDVLGVIEGWGGYRTGDRGFRCSKAQIVAMHVYANGRGEDWLTAAEQALAHVYQVPVYSAVGTMLKAHPTSRSEPASSRQLGGGQNQNHPAYPAQARFGNIPLSVPCMTCHRATADTITTTVGSGTIFHCGTCGPAWCGCPQHSLPRPALSPLDALGILDAKRHPPG